MTIHPNVPPVTVSAVTSVFNQEKTIGQAIESVLALGDCVIPDDASTDMKNIFGYVFNRCVC